MVYETDHVCPTQGPTNKRAKLLTILDLQVAFFDIYRHLSTRRICPGNVVVTEVSLLGVFSYYVKQIKGKLTPYPPPVTQF